MLRPSPFFRYWRRRRRRRRLLYRLLLYLLLGYHWGLFCEDASKDSEKVEYGGLVPVLCPLRQIWMIDPPITADMLPWSH
jgi:hypothetical protein